MNYTILYYTEIQYQHLINWNEQGKIQDIFLFVGLIINCNIRTLIHLKYKHREFFYSFSKKIAMEASIM